MFCILLLVVVVVVLKNSQQKTAFNTIDWQDNVMEIFSLAHRFDMGDLLRACAEVLDSCMNCSDVCRVLEAAKYYGHRELAAKCWDLIKDNTPR